MQKTNLVLQIVTLGIILASLALKKRGNYVWHGNLMFTAVIINTLLLASHMGPAIVGVGGDIIKQPEDVTAIIGLAHGSLGGVAEILSIWIVATWASIQQSTQYCAKRRKMMKIAYRLWLVALLLGITYYVVHTVFPS